jgi:hypothetical protein
MKRILHKACLLSAVVLLLLMSVPITALADGGAEELIQTVDGYQVTIVLEKPITVGENQIHLQVADAQGQPVTNADVEVGVVAVEADHAEIEAAPQEDLHGMESTPEHDAPPTPQSSMGGMEGMSEQVATPTPQSDMHGMEAAPEEDAASEPADEHDEMMAFTAGHEAGEYEGEIVVAGSGEWAIRVHVTVDDHLIEFDFPVHVAGAQSTGKNILLGFFAINAGILGIAFTMKFKSAAA